MSDLATITDQEYNVIWKPLEGSQESMITCPANRQLWVGTRGSGKTECQLAYFRQFVGLGYGAHLTGLFVGTSYKSMQDAITKSKRMYHKFNDGAKFLGSHGSLAWVFPDGERLLFRVVNTEEQYSSVAHGNEFPFILINEICDFTSLDIIDLLHSSSRHSFVPERDSPIDPDTGVMNVLPPLPIISIATGNPAGRSAKAVQERYLPEGVEYGDMQTISQESYNPQTDQFEVMSRTQVALFSSWIENIHLPPDYGVELANVSDPVKRDAWFYGKFSSSDDNSMLADVILEQNILKDFVPTMDCTVYRIYDHGESAPFAAAWVAVPKYDVEINVGGEPMQFLKNDLIVFRERYGWNGKPNRGLRLLSEQISQIFVQEELDMGLYGRVRPGVADSAIYNVADGNCIAENLAKSVYINGKKYKGPTFVPADKGKGSRKTGYSNLRTAFSNAHQISGNKRTRPALYITESCDEGMLRTLKLLQRSTVDSDDTSPQSEDHCADVLRYLVNTFASNFSITGKTSGYF